MKRAVSVSLGSSKRDKAVEIELLGETIRLERIGTDGDMKRAAERFRELDGEVDAFGVGGADLGALVDGKWYPLYSVQPMIQHVRHTPVVDGAGLKTTLEYRVGPFIESRIGDYISLKGRRVLVALGVDRWGMSRSFVEQGYQCVFGDLMFGLGIPLALHSARSIKFLAALLMPIAGRLPFEWLYPTGEKQEVRVPRWEKYYIWATVVAGDRHYVVRHMPNEMPGKVIVTNTTTAQDVEDFRKAGVKYLVTTTPVIEGRSFGTNAMEAALVALAGKGRKLTDQELGEYLDRLGIQPQLQELN